MCICRICRIPHTNPVHHLQGLRHTTWRSYNSRGLLELPEANVAIGRAGAEMDGIEMEELSTLLELLPAARGCDDVPPRRQPNDEPTDELPLRADAQLPERVCPSSAGPTPK